MLREGVTVPEVQEGTVRVPVFTLLAPGQQQVPPGGLRAHQLQPQLAGEDRGSGEVCFPHCLTHLDCCIELVRRLARVCLVASWAVARRGDTLHSSSCTHEVLLPEHASQ